MRGGSYEALARAYRGTLDWVVPPDPEASPSEHAAAQLLARILLASLVVVGGFLAARLLLARQVPGASDAALLLAEVGFGGAIGLMRRGRVALASRLTICGSWLAMVLTAWSGSGVRDPALAAALIPVMMAGLLQRPRSVALLGLGTVACAWLLAGSELAASRATTTYSPQRLALDWTAIATLVAALVMVYAADARRAAGRIRTELAERRRAEAAASERERNYREVFDSVPDALLLQDAQSGVVLDANAAAAQTFRAAWEQLIGLNPGDLGHNEAGYDGTRAARRLAEAVATGLCHFEWLARRLDGTTFWAEVRLHRSEIGGVGRVLAIIRDIDERKAAELATQQAAAALTASELQYRLLAENSFDYVTLTDDEGIVLYLSPGSERVVGWRPEERVGGSMFDLVPPEYLTAAAQAFLRLLTSGEEQTQELPVRHKAGHLVWCEARRRRFEPGPDEHAPRFITVIRDVTARREAEQALARSERRLSLAVAATADAIWDWDLTSGETYFSPRWYEMLGYDNLAMPMTIQVWRDLTHPEDAEATLASVRASLAEPGQRGFSADFRMQHRDGHWVWVQGRGNVVARDAAGRALKVSGTNSDISDRKRAEEALRESEETLRTIMEASPSVAIQWFDEEGRCVYWNAASERILGWSAEQARAKRLSDLDYQAAHHATLPAVLRAVAETGTAHGPAEVCVTGSDGQAAWVISTMFAITRHDGQRVFVSIGVDITQRKRAEQEMLREKQFTDTLLASLPGIFYLYELDAAEPGQSRLIRFNQNHVDVTGYTADELLTKTIADWYSPEMQRRAAAAISVVAAQGDSQAQLDLQCKDGHLVPFLFTGRVIEQDGKPCFLGFGIDVSAQRAIEAEREELIGALEAQNAELERFAYTVSHDLKSPLITIKGFLGWLRSDLDEGRHDRLLRYVERIEAASEHMARMLSELLELSRIGRLTNPPEAVSFAGLAVAAVELLDGAVERHGARLDLVEPLPVVHGDRARLLEALQNLLENALRFSSERAEPHVTVGCAGTDAASGWPLLYVRDNGIGFDPAYAERIFGLFEQLNPGGGGTGIGLALVKRIIEIHGGRVWAESAGPDQGACFWFTLPPAEPPIC